MAEKLGHGMLKYFAFKEGWTNVNNGSFGSVPKPVLESLRNFRDDMEALPDPFLRYDCVGHLNEARKAAAGQLGADVANVVMVPNATTGINTVLKNLKYDAKDVIIYFSVSYGACQNIVLSTVEENGCKAHRVQLDYPLSDDTLLSRFEEAVKKLRDQGLRPKALLIDTVVSLPGVRMPFEDLTEACRKQGILSVVDGAHGYGLMPFDLKKLDPDFFASNCHKWGFTPRPCAVLFVAQRNQHLVRTTIPTSHYFVPKTEAEGDGKSNPLGPPQAGDTPFTKLFEFVGTADNAPYFSLPAALKFRQEICGGEQRVMEYCSQLAAEGGAAVAKILGTEVLDNDEGTLTGENPMVNVRLPLTPVAEKASASNRLVQLDERGPGHVVQWAQKNSMAYDTFIPFVWHAGSFWVRLSAQIYLELEDFERIGVIVKEICGKVAAGEHLAVQE